MYRLSSAGPGLSQPGMPNFITRELWIYRVFNPYFVSTSLQFGFQEAIYVLSHLLWTSLEDIVMYVGSTASATHKPRNTHRLDHLS